MEAKLVGGESGTGGRGQPNLQKMDFLSGRIRFSLHIFSVSKERFESNFTPEVLSEIFGKSWQEGGSVCDELNTVISLVKQQAEQQFTSYNCITVAARLTR